MWDSQVLGKLLQAEEFKLNFGNEANQPCPMMWEACEPAPPQIVFGLCLVQT